MDLKNHKSLEKENLQKHTPKTFLFYHEMPPIFLQGKFSVFAVLASKQSIKQRIWSFEIPINAPYLHNTEKRHKKAYFRIKKTAPFASGPGRCLSR